MLMDYGDYHIDESCAECIKQLGSSDGVIKYDLLGCICLLESFVVVAFLVVVAGREVHISVSCLLSSPTGSTTTLNGFWISSSFFSCFDSIIDALRTQLLRFVCVSLSAYHCLCVLVCVSLSVRPWCSPPCSFLCISMGVCFFVLFVYVLVTVLSML